MNNTNISTNYTSSANMDTFIAYNIADYRLASSVDDIDQILDFQLKPEDSSQYDFIYGFINYNNTKVPVIDTYYLLCGEKSPNSTSVLITTVNDMQFGFSVDKITGMIKVTEENEIKDFASIAKFTKLNINGITSQPDGIRIIINPEDLLGDDNLTILLKLMGEAKDEKTETGNQGNS